MIALLLYDFCFYLNNKFDTNVIFSEYKRSAKWEKLK